MKTVKSKNKKECKKYGMAITNYVLGEKIDVPEKELLEHLRGCKQCRDEIMNWQDFNAVLSTEQYHSRPEVIEKWNRFIGAITEHPEYFAPVKPGEKVILDNEKDIGKSAGLIWNLLGKEGKVPVIQIPFKAGLPLDIAYGAMGWLAKEKKIYREKNEIGIYVDLAKTERQIYQRQNGLQQ
ncbi:MAG: winged helix-turn-helix domain-containing protein [Planctomycetota bacterium]|nr:winged helix-turn-helix domain-containing protein [Planctomycetota bacterium]MDI6788376.1 winged helix-turn-helix domain-containing protein [Planctomycetota bacterium]